MGLQFWKQYIILAATIVIRNSPILSTISLLRKTSRNLFGWQEATNSIRSSISVL